MTRTVFIAICYLFSVVLTHSSRSFSNGDVGDLRLFHLPSQSQYVSSREIVHNTEPYSITSENRSNYLRTATQLVTKVAPNSTFRIVDDHYIGENGIAHVRFRQTLRGVDIGNADFNVNVDKDGKIFSYGHSFHMGDATAAAKLLERHSSDPVAALRAVADVLHLPISVEKAFTEPIAGSRSHGVMGISGAVSEPKATLTYFVDSEKKLRLTWSTEIDAGHSWIVAYVDAGPSRKIHGVIDYFSHADFEVYKWGVNNPEEEYRSVLTDPWDKGASPFTWVGDGAQNYSTTHGNNAIAQDHPLGSGSYLENFRPVDPECRFKYPYNVSMSPPESYINASIVQLFYTANMYHDLLYILGFNEKAGNFQWNNNGKGGRDHDYVILNSQDAGGLNGANFATPPDGEPGRMRVTMWDESTPWRDGCFDAGLVIHEYTHGLSNRLTGGPANSGCLSALESRAMGEGWSDFMATAIRLKANDTRATDYAFGEWASNQKGGLREYLYSTSLTTNPLTYASISDLQTGHRLGTLWGTMLYEVLWNLIDQHGKNDSPKPVFKENVPTDGRYLAMKLVIDGMALQPCNPTFVQARDAILDADTALTNGTNHCSIWKGFAKRGLGYGIISNSSGTNDNGDVPPGAC